MATWAETGLQLIAGNFYSTGTGNKRAFAEQINAIIMADRGNKVVSGCASTVGAQTNLPTSGTHLVIASGTVLVGGAKLSFAGANVDLSGAHNALAVGQARYVLITIYDSASTATIRATNGSIYTDGNQEPPEFPQDEVAIAIIYLEEADETMDVNNIGDWNFDVPKGDYIAGDGEITGDLDLSGHDFATIGLRLAGTLITASAPEINILDGALLSTTELNYLNGVTGIGLAVGNLIDVNSTLVTGEYAKVLTDGLESRSVSEHQSDINVSTGIGVGAVPRLEGTPTNLDYLKLTATGVEGRSFTEVVTDISGLAIGNAVKVDGTLVVAEYVKVLGTGVESKTFTEVRSDLAVAHGIAVGNKPQLEGTPANLDYLKLTTTGMVGRSYSEVRTDLALVIGTNVLAQQIIGIGDNNLVEIDMVGVVGNDYAKFTTFGLEGKSYSEVRTDLALVIGTNVLAQQIIGIADNNLVEIDMVGVVGNDYAKFTINGLEGRSYSEVASDIGAATTHASLTDTTLTGPQLEDLLKFGVGNPASMPIHSYNTVTGFVWSKNDADRQIVLLNGATGTNRFHMIIPLPSDLGSLSLKIASISMWMESADGSNYVDDIYLYWNDGGTVGTLASDTALGWTTAGQKSWNPTDVDCTGRPVIILRFFAPGTTSVGNLKIAEMVINYYYS